jgi:hypothetical protein
VELLGHWYNDVPDGGGRRDVWAERLDDGRFQVRWRGGEWTDRDGRYRTRDEKVALEAIKQLVGSPDEGWRRAA